MPQLDSSIGSSTMAVTLYLGTGGSTPGFHALDCASGEVTPISRYSAGESIYAACVAGAWAAKGSRGGRIDLFQLGLGREPGERFPRTALREAGNQVTAIAGTQDGALVAADTGGVFLWPDPVRDPGTCLKLDAGVHVICALCVDTNMVFGLAQTGHLVSWRIPDGDLVSTVAGPQPGPKAALTSLVSCGPSTSIAYLASGGALVRYSIKTGTFNETRAHDGEAYAAISTVDFLVTVGRLDGKLHLWVPDSDVPRESISVPRGIVGGALIPGASLSILLIDDKGRAGIWELKDGRATKVRELVGDAYRSVAGLSPSAFHEAQNVCRDAEVRRIVKILLSDNGGMAEAQRVALHAQLRQLGKEAVSLEILAQTAARRGTADPAARIEELHYRHRQGPLLSETTDSVPVFQSIAESYEAFWLLEEAFHVREQIRRIQAPISSAPIENNRWLENAAASLVDGSALLDLAGDCPLDTHLDAHDVIGTMASGIFTIGNMQPIRCAEGDLDEGLVADIFAETWPDCAYQGFSIPPIAVKQVSWITFKHVDSCRMFLATAPLDLGGPTVSLAVPLRSGATHLPAMIVLTMRVTNRNPFPKHAQLSSSTSGTEHNDAIRRANAWLSKNGVASTWFESAWTVMQRAMRRVTRHKEVLFAESGGGPL